MNVIDTIKEDLAAATKKSYLYDRIAALKKIEERVSARSAHHEEQMNDASSEGLRFFAKGSLVTGIVTAGACFALGALGLVVAVPGFMGSLFGMIHYEQSDKGKAKARSRHEEKHGAEIESLAELKKAVKMAQEKELTEFNALPLDQKVGVSNLDKLIVTYSEFRDGLLQAFRESAGKPIYEQAAVKPENTPPPPASDPAP